MNAMVLRKLTRLAKRLLDPTAKKARLEEQALRSLPSVHCNLERLERFSREWLLETLHNPEFALGWREDAVSLDALSIPDMSGGVNQGDRRALYYLARSINARSILEIGTHIGSSTAAFALALERNRAGSCQAQLTTVDICDVNHEHDAPWSVVGAKCSPRNMIDALNTEVQVEFVVDRGGEYLVRRQNSYDLIFLDGDHSAPAVYGEIPLALERLSQGGAIVLHDYFPQGRPLWPEKPVIWGPWLAAARLVLEQPHLKVVPLGALPWTTKLGSRITSLAILSK